MDRLTLQDLLDANRPGGASSLSIVTEMAPAAGPHAGVAPAKYVRGSDATYLFQTRFVDGDPQRCVVLDSKQSALNRVEEQINFAVLDDDGPLARTPRIVVQYPDAELSCLTLPHRAFDGHIRAGTVDGRPVTGLAQYRAIRDANPLDVRPVLEASPHSLAFGAWDSTRKSHQGRYRSALVGEIIGVLASQDPEADIPVAGGARSDAYAPSVRLPQAEMKTVLDGQRDELSAKNITGLEKEIAGRKPVSGAALGLGSVPPSLVQLGVVGCRRIIRSYLLSFSTLRSLRFGGGLESDVACRALLAAYALAGAARAMTDPRLRANCDLIEKAPPEWNLDARYGRVRAIEPLQPAEADALLADAIAHAEDAAAITWNGTVLTIIGNPLIAQNKTDDEVES